MNEGPLCCLRRLHECSRLNFGPFPRGTRTGGSVNRRDRGAGGPLRALRVGFGLESHNDELMTVYSAADLQRFAVAFSVAPRELVGTEQRGDPMSAD